MHEKIKVAIAGYGNIGKGVLLSLLANEDMEPVGVFTRRAPSSLNLAVADIPVYSMEEAIKKKDAIDVMILCGGSATDLPVMGPELAKLFHTIDSFDTHAKIPDYFAAMQKASAKTNHVSILSVGWDPGLFSINRLYAEAILPGGANYTFWGSGVSQGKSDAIRRLPGVKNAIQYTVPVDEAVAAARSGENPSLSTRQKHTRECFVVPCEGADLTQIEKTIKEMPNYFSDYNTTVTFITEEELKTNHSAMPHGGFVIRSGKTNQNTHNHVMEYSLKLDSNPEFTACVLTAYARAAYRLAKKKDFGAKTVFDIAPALISPLSPEEQRAALL